MRKWIVAVCLCFLVLLFSYCRQQAGSAVSSDSPYLNHSDTAEYVGMSVCRQCHADKFSTFVHTGMGMSFGLATKEKSAALFGPHVQVYDSILDFYYHPFWQGDSLMIMEFRLDGADTMHKRTEHISYIIGSGQHTNSHLLQVNGYLYQAPITFYTQKQEWDMAPGMSGGFNSRFGRVIESECVTCHNGLPEQVAGSVNKYTGIPLGIDCERCHGPGSIHVARISSGIAVDTANAFDYSIVNPRGLSTELQNDLCFRCHLQGINVLHPGKEFADFKPGQHIRDYWNIFLPRFDGKNDQFLMASQADRLVQSKCFIESGKISCITCHNPHVTVKETPISLFNKPCLDCHQLPQSTCTETLEVRSLQNDNCSGCHIPKSGSIDIPHVSISDHKIQIPGREQEKEDGKFTGLVALTDPDIEPVEMARGYLRYYEGFVSESAMLDSAKAWLERSRHDDLYDATQAHLWYLQGNMQGLLQMDVKMGNKVPDSWTAYRLGEALLQEGNYSAAANRFKQAVDQLPLQLDFRFKYASALYLDGQTEDAGKEFLFITRENPGYEKAWMNLAVWYINKGDVVAAEEALQNAVALNPDYLQARLTLTDLYLRTRQRTKAGVMMQYLLRYHRDEPLVQELNMRYRSL
ncbi:MAG: tetratricopeptide repeat protein [Chitinophagales bacterium]|nr:tetratricopeptide repeat protein [Chitinophagales bacterium]HAE14633.1 pilus assembly protein TadD [Bacteroidota bacterium]MCB9021769.1 tetratricopeptide repeat protein [Chitinophagales bacterium]HAE36002.1 pilus assembly protein TadD [Bacteroidota bacterium]HPE96368.1 tetratricopeptide repeat protein [Chitinophagales bacterium]